MPEKSQPPFLFFTFGKETTKALNIEPANQCLFKIKIMYFSGKSKALLDQANPKLKALFELVIDVTDVDFGISETLRSKERQEELFRTGKSKTLNSKHLKGDAVDIFIASKKYAYDEKHLCYLAGIIRACAYHLNINIRWGSNWDGDTVIVYDQLFDDYCHFELVM